MPAKTAKTAATALMIDEKNRAKPAIVTWFASQEREQYENILASAWLCKMARSELKHAFKSFGIYAVGLTA